jgi:GTP cyclohydrolase I
MSKPDLQAATAAMNAFLRAIGRDPEAEADLRETPQRVAEMFALDLCAGYQVDATALLAKDAMPLSQPHAGGGEKKQRGAGSDVVVLRDLAVTTTCPHHLMPATGVATVAFAPREKLVGIGTVGRALDALSRRLTLQEEIGQKMAQAVYDALAPAWAGCRLVMTHTCLTARGARRHGARVETVSIVPAGSDALAYHVLAQGCSP